jgi:hypothetical protein
MAGGFVVRETDYPWTRRLLWLYFWLLIFEGALRKWFVPSLATPLLLVRDPIALAILVSGIMSGTLKRTIAFYLWIGVSVLLLLAAIAVIPNQIPVIVYGFKCNILHVPIVFIGAEVLRKRDFEAFLRWTLVLAIPMAILMVFQFRSPAHSWVNSGMDDTFKQIGSAQGHVRAAGTFSFIAGPIMFFSLVAAFWLGAFFDGRPENKVLMISVGIALLIACAVSGSRSLLGEVAVVFLVSFAGGMILNPKKFGAYIKALMLILLIAAALSQSSLMQESSSVFAERISNASRNEGGFVGFVERALADPAKAYDDAGQAPALGYGLGMGTTAASAYLTGKGGFLLAESEWPRIVMESGPAVGLVYILFRLTLSLWLVWRSIAVARLGKVMPLCIASACFMSLAEGSWGQPTVLGFSVFIGGMCLAAIRDVERESRQSPPQPAVPSRPIPSFASQV